MRFVAFALLATAPLSLAACGSSGTAKSSSTTTTGAGPAGSTDQAAVQACLKKQGVDLPDFGANGGQPPSGFDPSQGGTPPSLPAGGSGNVDPDKLQAAMKACGVSGNGFPGGAAGAGNQQAFQAYASCMQDHGVTISVPSSNGGTTPSSTATTVDRNSQAFKDASHACAALLPSRAGTTTTTKG